MGIKPLTRTTVEDTLLFASEVKAFRAHEGHRPKLDPLALGARLVWEYPLDATTLLDGVYQVRPGTVECWGLDAGGRPVLQSTANVQRQAIEPEVTWDPALQA